MGKITEQEYDFVTTAPDTVMSLDFPGRINLKKLNVVRVGGGDIVVDIYNRAFTGPAVSGIFRSPTASELLHRENVTRVDGLVVFESSSSILLRAGDTVSVDSDDPAYAGKTLRVRFVDIEQNFAMLDAADTGQPPSAGTITLGTLEEEQVFAQVMPQQVGVDKILYFPEFDGGTLIFHNRDVIDSSYNIGVIRKIYLKLSEAAEYRVAIAGEETI